MRQKTEAEYYYYYLGAKIKFITGPIRAIKLLPYYYLKKVHRRQTSDSLNRVSQSLIGLHQPLPENLDQLLFERKKQAPMVSAEDLFDQSRFLIFMKDHVRNLSIQTHVKS